MARKQSGGGMNWKLLVQGFILLIEGILLGMLIEYVSPTIQTLLVFLKPAEIVMRNL